MPEYAYIPKKYAQKNDMAIELIELV